MTEDAGFNKTDAPVDFPAALTIAGSDSGGGAGIQADLKTFQALGVFGTCAVTCITAQNPDRVTKVEPVTAEMVVSQIAAVCDGFTVGAAKTGMLYSSDLILAVASAVKPRFAGKLVVDPVMVATSGDGLLKDEAVEALKSDLLPLAAVFTPNLPEAEILCGHRIVSEDDLAAVAGELGRSFGAACIMKGGHLVETACGGNGSDEVVDALFFNGQTTILRSPRIPAKETHGTGCTFSAALTAYLASGSDMPAAFAGAKEFTAKALRCAVRVGEHYPLGVGSTEDKARNRKTL